MADIECAPAHLLKNANLCNDIPDNKDETAKRDRIPRKKTKKTEKRKLILQINKTKKK